jgi:hypothetical protein
MSRACRRKPCSAARDAIRTSGLVHPSAIVGVDAGARSLSLTGVSGAGVDQREVARIANHNRSADVSADCAAPLKEPKPALHDFRIVPSQLPHAMQACRLERAPAGS